MRHPGETIYQHYDRSGYPDVFGTATEIAEKLGVTRGYVQWLATPTARRRRKTTLAEVIGHVGHDTLQEEDA